MADRLSRAHARQIAPAQPGAPPLPQRAEDLGGALFRSFAEHSTNLLWVAHPGAGVIEYRSPAYERIWGQPRAQAPSRLDDWLACVHPRRRRGRKPRGRHHTWRDTFMGSVIKKRRKRMAKKKHRKLLRKTRVARRKAGK